MMDTDILLETRHLKKYYGQVHAVDDVSLTIHRGRSLGLIGESGSGKSTFGRLAARLEKPDSGEVYFQGERVDGLPEGKFRPMRRNLQIIFQSSGGVFDPCYTIGDSLKECLGNFEHIAPEDAEQRVRKVLSDVGLDPDLEHRYARQLSGGQCQRANIARALILHPELIICDEPVSSLDYSIRKQILNLMNEIQKEQNVTYLLITHDLSNVPYVCKEVAIMYQGSIVEYLDRTDRIGEMVLHPYSRLLFSSIPNTDPRKRTVGKEETLPAVPEPTSGGCPFRSRCPLKEEICGEKKPSLVEEAPGHLVACHCLHKHMR